MSLIKTTPEISLIRDSSHILAKVLYEMASRTIAGVTTGELDAFATARIHKLGGEPSFFAYQPSRHEKPFPSASCISINDEVVHAPAFPSRTLKQGDVVGIDLGVRYKGWCSDMAVTVGVGEMSAEARKLVSVTRDALDKGMAAVRDGAHVSDISKAVQNYAERFGYGVVRDLVGHGIGRNLHEDPKIPNFVGGGFQDVVLKEGMVICIEPMVTAGDWRVKTLNDGWTVSTVDSSLGAHFEHTFVVTKNGFELLTV